MVGIFKFFCRNVKGSVFNSAFCNVLNHWDTKSINIARVDMKNSNGKSCLLIGKYILRNEYRQ